MKGFFRAVANHRQAIARSAMLVVGIAVSVQGMAESPKALVGATEPVDVRRVPAVNGNAIAGAEKSAVCGACHGADGKAIIPGYPSLAGQQADYLYLQLKSFARGWRKNAVMQAQVAALSDQNFHDLAIHYAALPRRVIAPQNSDSTSLGRMVYLEGQPANGIPPCQGCHGPTGVGLIAKAGSTNAASGEVPQNYRTYPLLAGQSSGYVAAQLAAFKAGTRGGTSNAQIMRGVARNIDDETAAALGNYLEGLKTP